MANYNYTKEQLLKITKELEFSSLEKTELEFLAADLHLRLEEAKDAIRFLSGSMRHQEIYIGRLKSELNNIVKGKLASGIVGTSYKMGKRNQMLESAKKSVQVKLSRDPKQVEIKNIRKEWNNWQKSPDKYPGAAEFARQMLNKCNHLKSTKHIENLCSEWKKELQKVSLQVD